MDPRRRHHRAAPPPPPPSRRFHPDDAFLDATHQPDPHLQVHHARFLFEAAERRHRLQSLVADARVASPFPDPPVRVRLVDVDLHRQRGFVEEELARRNRPTGRAQEFEIVDTTRFRFPPRDDAPRVLLPPPPLRVVPVEASWRGGGCYNLEKWVERKGKRAVVGGESARDGGVSCKAKPSVHSRIQFNEPVWNRLEERLPEKRVENDVGSKSNGSVGKKVSASPLPAGVGQERTPKNSPKCAVTPPPDGNRNLDGKSANKLDVNRNLDGKSANKLDLNRNLDGKSANKLDGNRNLDGKSANKMAVLNKSGPNKTPNKSSTKVVLVRKRKKVVGVGNPSVTKKKISMGMPKKSKLAGGTSGKDFSSVDTSVPRPMIKSVAVVKDDEKMSKAKESSASPRKDVSKSDKKVISLPTPQLEIGSASSGLDLVRDVTSNSNEKVISFPNPELEVSTNSSYSPMQVISTPNEKDIPASTPKIEVISHPDGLDSSLTTPEGSDKKNTTVQNCNSAIKAETNVSLLEPSVQGLPKKTIMDSVVRKLNNTNAPVGGDNENVTTKALVTSGIASSDLKNSNLGTPSEEVSKVHPVEIPLEKMVHPVEIPLEKMVKKDLVSSESHLERPNRKFAIISPSCGNLDLETTKLGTPSGEVSKVNIGSERKVDQMEIPLDEMDKKDLISETHLEMPNRKFASVAPGSSNLHLKTIKVGTPSEEVSNVNIDSEREVNQVEIPLIKMDMKVLTSCERYLDTSNRKFAQTETESMEPSSENFAIPGAVTEIQNLPVLNYTQTSTKTNLSGQEQKVLQPLLKYPQAVSDGQAFPSECRKSDVGLPQVSSISNCEKPKADNPKSLISFEQKSGQEVASDGLGIGNLCSRFKQSTLLAPSSTSTGYFMTKKNQLIRDPSLSNNHPKKVVFNDNRHNQRAPVTSLGVKTGTPCKQKTHKATGLKSNKHPFSMVWRLNGVKPHEEVSSTNSILPRISPWKRATYWQKSLSGTLRKESVTPIRKLQLSRKRDTIYTVSSNGYSLKKSGVVSIGGPNLKWSKSIERHSKKANEEATLALAESQKRKREQKSSGTFSTKRNIGSHLPRKRIFRIGSVRYKMDSSRRTLVRIPGEVSPSPIKHQSSLATKIPFIPKRLSIGHDEYVCIGNGNKLVRDPKKHVRVLASEKIRWSLHTARLRLAKKKQYCLFFTRFGKCNKDNGKCPYTHDIGKVAICTKFLKGSCSGSKCKLTHKVIPERMPDCSYFLQGLCTKTICPYRHVNVNPNSSVCEGFLKGYCPDGDECRKKHTYVCPEFEATGKCKEGSSCKLHHRKLQNKSTKRKRSNDLFCRKDRYFDFGIIEAPMAKKGHSSVHIEETNDKDVFLNEGRFADYISIRTSDAYDNEDDPLQSCTTMMDLNLSNTLLGDIETLIKPVGIMNRNPM